MTKQEIIDALREINRLSKELTHGPSDYLNFGKIQAISERLIKQIKESSKK